MRRLVKADSAWDGSRGRCILTLPKRAAFHKYGNVQGVVGKIGEARELFLPVSADVLIPDRALERG